MRMRVGMAGRKTWFSGRSAAMAVAALLTAAAWLGSAAASAQHSESGTYPAAPYNGLQITYQISGARIASTVEDDNWTRTLTFKGSLGSGELRVSGVARRSGGWNPPTVSATLQVTVEVDGESDSAKADLLRDSTAPFDVGVPIPLGAKSGRIEVALVGIYNVGTRNVKLIGHFERGAAHGGGSGGGTEPPPPEVKFPKKSKPSPPPTPAPGGLPGLRGTIKSCQRDPFGRASGPDIPLPGALVIAGRNIDFETGLTGEDVVKNAGNVAGKATTDAGGNYVLDLPPGDYRVIVWRRHYVPQIDSKVTAPGIYNRSICDNIDPPATHELLRFSDTGGGGGSSGETPPAKVPARRNSGTIVSYPKIKELSGGDYNYTARHDGVLLKRNTDGQVVMVEAGLAGRAVAERFKHVLSRDPGLAQQLGNALSGDVPVFNDALRVQVFRGGALIHELATGVIWISRHEQRRQ